MKIIPDPSTVIRADKSIVLEHDGEQIRFPIALYKKDLFTSEKATFSTINQYWESLRPKAQKEIFEIYTEVRELFDSMIGVVELTAELKRLVARLMVHHDDFDMTTWIRMSSGLRVPSSVAMEYVYDRDRQTTEDKTYVVPDYHGLMGLSVTFRAMMPIWSTFVDTTKKDGGKVYKEINAFSLLDESSLINCKSMLRLSKYIESNKDKITHNGNHVLELLPSGDIVRNHLALVCVRRLCTGDLYPENQDQNLAALVHNYVVERPAPNSADLSTQVKAKRISGDEADRGQEGTRSVLEAYKARSVITVGRHAEIEEYMLHPHELAIKLCPNLPDYKELLTNLDTALQTSGDLYAEGLQDPQTFLMSYVLSQEVTPIAMFYLDTDVLVPLAAVCEAVLRQKGYHFLALLATAYHSVTDTNMRVSALSGKTRPEDDVQSRFKEQYPLVRVSRKRSANSAEHCFATEDLKTLSLAFNNYAWCATAERSFLHSVTGGYQRRLHLPPSLRADLTSMCVSMQEQRMEVNEKLKFEIENF